ncbi:unnamed protein product [Linum trigynum]|uniref:Uncharacterized protein n=1 Tax=Linum trigynum TaxID=586398 RepID=A0AAV2D340_9ROSI
MSRKSGKIAGEVSTSSGSTNTTTIWLLWSLACVAPSSSLSPTRSQSTETRTGGDSDNSKSSNGFGEWKGIESEFEEGTESTAAATLQDRPPLRLHRRMEGEWVRRRGRFSKISGWGEMVGNTKRPDKLFF